MRLTTTTTSTTILCHIIEPNTIQYLCTKCKNGVRLSKAIKTNNVHVRQIGANKCLLIFRTKKSKNCICIDLNSINFPFYLLGFFFRFSSNDDKVRSKHFSHLAYSFARLLEFLIKWRNDECVMYAQVLSIDDLSNKNEPRVYWKTYEDRLF